MSQPILGTLSSLDDLFTDFLFAAKAPDGYFLLTGLPRSVRHKERTFLFARPKISVVAAVSARCTNGAIGGFRSVRSAYWMARDLLPVSTFDLPHISNILLAVVPYSEHARFETAIVQSVIAAIRR